MAERDPQLADTWARMMGVFSSRRNALFEQLVELKLHPPHGVALMSLLHAGPTRMGDMAESMACDASYITAVADRLEELGLAERRSSPDDRRSKQLALTAKGQKVARRLDAVVTEPPPAMAALSKADRDALARIARKISEPDTANWMPPRTLR